MARTDMVHPSQEILADRRAPISLELVPGARRDAIEPVWRQLEAQYLPVRLAVSWDWVSSWLDVFADAVPHWFAVAHVDGEAIGICLVTCRGPWLLRNRGLGIIQIGTAGEPIGHAIGTEYNDVLVDSEHRGDFARELLRTIRRQLWPVAIQLPAFSNEDIDAFIRHDTSFCKREAQSPVFDLSRARGQGVDPIALLRSSVRSRVRRSTKALQPIQTEWATTVDQANDILDDLIELHQERWTKAGRRGAFSSDRFLAFHRSLIPKLLRDERVVLFRVRQGSQTVGTLYSFIENGSILFYQCGFAQFDDNKIRPGLTTHLLCMEECMSRGYDTYNFLAGDHRYKDELSTAYETLLYAQTPGHPALAPMVQYAYQPHLRERMRALKHRGERLMLRMTS